MSNGNLKQFKLTKNLIESQLEDKAEEPSSDAITRVYKNKHSRVKKALNFETKGTKPKLA